MVESGVKPLELNEIRDRSALWNGVEWWNVGEWIPVPFHTPFRLAKSHELRHLALDSTIPPTSGIREGVGRTPSGRSQNWRRTASRLEV